MAYDGMAGFRIGEQRPVYCTLSGASSSTTVTIVSGTFTLYDPDGIAVIGPVAITGFDGAGTAPKAWYVLDTSSLNGDVWYVGRFDMVATYSDGVSRPDVAPEIAIYIGPRIEASYDASRLQSVPLYQLRLHAADTNIEDAVWSDNELLYFLSITPNPQWGAIKALQTELIDAAKLSFRITLGNLGDEESDVHRSLLDTIALLMRQAPGFTPKVNPPTRVFTQNMPDGTLGSTNLW